MQDSGSLAVFKVTARDQGHYKGPSGAFVTYCNISCLFIYLLFCHYYYIANSTLLSLLRVSYFITPYDARASSAYSALNDIGHCTVLHCDAGVVSLDDQSNAETN